MRAVGGEGHVVRFGGDEFLVICTFQDDASRPARLAQAILDNFSENFRVDGEEFSITASIGIAQAPEHGERPQQLIQSADVAMYDSKRRGRNAWQVFSTELAEQQTERLQLETHLRRAVDNDEFELVYQPQVDLASGALVGVEALARWNHPELGSVPPGRFIPLAEELGLIDDIGAWVLREACRQMAAWQDDGLSVPCVAVNLSVQQIEHGVLPTLVADVLRQTGLESGRLELEITESTIMREPEKAIAVLREIHDQGVKISIDDFGIGHSSLSYVKRLPVDRLKIDQSFVREIGRDVNDEAICRTVIELARNLGLAAIAEGVERQEQVDFLRREGCRFAQGYLFSKPLPADALRELWRAAPGRPGRPPGERDITSVETLDRR
jgi:predicted signal transduction protein with EAL and GGDEF domain